MSNLNPAQIARVLANSTWAKSEWVTGVAVAMAESGGVTTATNHNSNGTTDVGLFQINSTHSGLPGWSGWRDPITNALMAKSIWEDAGNSWSPWVTYSTGAYKRHLNEARMGVHRYTKDHDIPMPSSFDAINNSGSVVQTTGLNLPNVGELFTLLASPHFWMRVGMSVGGMIMIVMGGYYLTKSTKVGNEVLGDVGDLGGAALNIAGSALGGKELLDIARGKNLLKTGKKLGKK